MLIEKLVGAAAERGDSLEACAALGRKLNNLGHSIGIAIGACTVPAAGQPSFTLQDNEMEFGVGIHGEPGIDRRAFSSLDQTVDEMFDTLLENGHYSRTLRHWDNIRGARRKVKKPNKRCNRATASLRWSITLAQRRYPSCSASITVLKAAVRMRVSSSNAI